MATAYPLPTSRGSLFYKPNVEQPRFTSVLAPRRPRPSRIVTAELLQSGARDLNAAHRQPSKPRNRLKGRLATTREDTFRRLRSIIATSSTTVPKEDIIQPVQGGHGLVQRGRSNTQEMPGPDFLRGGMRNASSQRPSVSSGSNAPSPARSRQGSLVDAKPPVPPEEKPVAIGHGVSVSINLAEPVLFLQGFEPGDAAQRSTAMLRGTLHLKIAKNAKIKGVSLKFKGSACTKWPEGM